MEKAIKKTKATYFEELKEIVNTAVEDQEQKDELIEFIDKQLETLKNRKEAAAKRAEQKKAESDALTEEIYAVLGEDLMTLDQIVEALDSEDVTRNKVTARLGKLVKAERVEKEAVKVEGGGKRMAYRIASAE